MEVEMEVIQVFYVSHHQQRVPGQMRMAVLATGIVTGNWFLPAVAFQYPFVIAIPRSIRIIPNHRHRPNAIGFN